MNQRTPASKDEPMVNTGGLSSDEARRLLDQVGPNAIPEKEESLARRLLRRFWGPIPAMIEIAAILSAVVQKWEDFTIIVILLLANVIIDFRQESKALDALKALKEKLARRARVKRDGQWTTIDASELVPGDIVKLRIGDIAPADAKLLEGKRLQVDQSALTGESIPVDMAPGDSLYGQSIIKSGEMIAVVTATGPRTYFGKTASLVAQAAREEKSHFQKAVIRIGNFLIAIAAIMVAIIIIVALGRGDPPLEILRFALVLTIASIPVALPAVLSVTMAVGALKLAKRKAIVSRLVSIEEMAGIDVLCCDKTGTLTQNRMVMGEPTAYGDFTAGDLLVNAALASREEDHDPLETPIFESLDQSHLRDRLAACVVEDFTPFDPVSKRTEAVARCPEGRVWVTKGAPQVVLALCEDSSTAPNVQRDVDRFAERGDRTLGVAVKAEGDPSWRFVGLLPMLDPPREDSAAMIAAARDLGVHFKMLTGDNLAIARQISRTLGLGDDIRLAGELKDGRSHDEVDQLIEDADGFAQVFPVHKYEIVHRLQRRSHIVGMTGDGVNDAPALRKADAGIAVSGATDAARAAADLILLAPGLSVIVEAIREARQIFGRMTGYSLFRIAETVRVILFMTLAITIFNFYPVTAIMIVLLALLNDIPIMMIAYDNARVSPRPVRWNMTETLTVALALGIAGVASSFLIFFFLEYWKLEPNLIQAIMFLKLSVAGHSTIYVTRSGDHHFWKRPYPAKKFFVPAFGTQIIATFIAVYGAFMTPIGWKYAIIVWLYATAWFVFNDFVKLWTFRAVRAFTARSKHEQAPPPSVDPASVVDAA